MGIMPDYESEQLAKELQAHLDDKKAQDIVLMDLRGRSGFTDFFIVASGTSRTHVSFLAEEVDLFLHQHNLERLGVEGLPEATWVLVDAGDVIVHLFQRETRSFFDLEKLWSPKTNRVVEQKLMAETLDA